MIVMFPSNVSTKNSRVDFVKTIKNWSKVTILTMPGFLVYPDIILRNVNIVTIRNCKIFRTWWKFIRSSKIDLLIRNLRFHKLHKQHASLNQVYRSPPVSHIMKARILYKVLTKHRGFITNDLVIITWEIATQPFFLPLLHFQDSCLLLSSFRRFPENTLHISNSHIAATFF